MKFKTLILLALLGLAAAQGASASHWPYCVNKDLINIGPTAYDLAVILWGPQTLTWRYDGYPNGRFHKFTMGPWGGNTLLHWDNIGGVKGPIPFGKLIHVGWCTPRWSNVRTMYWTNYWGQRVPWSIVYNITSGWMYINGWGVRLWWRNQYVTDLAVAAAGAGTSAPASVTESDMPDVPITISNVHYAILPSPLPLDDLNSQNQALNSQFVPLPGGQSFTVAPGEEFELSLPGVPAGAAVVLRYEVTGPEASADALDFVQFVAEPEEATDAAPTDGK